MWFCLHFNSNFDIHVTFTFVHSSNFIARSPKPSSLNFQTNLQNAVWVGWTVSPSLAWSTSYTAFFDTRSLFDFRWVLAFFVFEHVHITLLFPISCRLTTHSSSRSHVSTSILFFLGFFVDVSFVLFFINVSHFSPLCDIKFSLTFCFDCLILPPPLFFSCFSSPQAWCFECFSILVLHNFYH